MKTHTLYDDNGVITIGSKEGCITVMLNWLEGHEEARFDYIEAEDLYSEDEIGNAMHHYRRLLKEDEVELDEHLGFYLKCTHRTDLEEHIANYVPMMEV